MIGTDQAPTVGDLLPKARGVFERSAAKILALEARWDPADGAPVFTVDGIYRARGWTEWTQGFQFGAALLQFDATGDRAFLDLGRSRTVERMAPHLTHVGVHDHGFNNVSTYGTLWRLAREGRIDASCSPHSRWPRRCEIARARSERTVSTKSECAPLNEWMNPPPGIGVHREAWTAPLTFNASS